MSTFRLEGPSAGLRIGDRVAGVVRVVGFERDGVPIVQFQQPSRRKNARTPERTFILYGRLPAPVYVLRAPAGVLWSDVRKACARLVRRWAVQAGHAMTWGIGGDPPDWDSTQQPRYIYSPNTGEFEPLEEVK